MGCEVSEKVHWPVKVVECRHLAADDVVQPPARVVVDEAVAHPHTSLHTLVNFVQKIKRILDAILSHLRGTLLARKCSLDDVAVELEDVEA